MKTTIPFAGLAKDVDYLMISPHHADHAIMPGWGAGAYNFAFRSGS